MAPTIRRATPEDAAGVAAVHVGSWRETYAGIFPDDFLAGLSVEDRAEYWGKVLADPATWVACDGDEIVGFLNVGPSRDEDLEEAQEIYCLYVLRSHHDRGLGRQLVEACLEFAGKGTLSLWVLERNDRARRFYEKAGFFADGTSKPAGIFGLQDPKMRYRRDPHA
ncbi:MAG: GNAT family N-acetyltransferase [Planctomycetota bacterium]|jgi:ribosomal protein S18 acetylase RimI-like enzyme